MKQIITTASSLLCLFLLPGCGNVGYHDLLPSFIPQHRLDKNGTQDLLALMQQDNLRSENVYDQFQTIALFDALKYSTATATAVAQLKADKYGINTSKSRQEVIKNEIEKSANELLFLVQADIRQAVEQDLSKNTCPWNFSLLTVDGQVFSPEIKKIKHTQMTKTLFGPKYSKFKTLYKFSFGLPCSSKKFQALRNGQLKLICQSSNHKVALTWPSEG